MKIYDKASWHIDSGEQAEIVVSRFKIIFTFLADKGLLNPEGLETLEFGMDSSVSLNNSMLNSKGESFLESYYDILISKSSENIEACLFATYQEFVEKLNM